MQAWIIDRDQRIPIRNQAQNNLPDSHHLESFSQRRTRYCRIQLEGFKASDFFMRMTRMKHAEQSNSALPDALAGRRLPNFDHTWSAMNASTRSRRYNSAPKTLCLDNMRHLKELFLTFSVKIELIQGIKLLQLTIIIGRRVSPVNQIYAPTNLLPRNSQTPSRGQNVEILSRWNFCWLWINLWWWDLVHMNWGK